MADVVTAFPAICDARPSLLTDVVSCNAALPAAARCMRAYLAHTSADALSAALADLRPNSSDSQVRLITPCSAPTVEAYHMALQRAAVQAAGICAAAAASGPVCTVLRLLRQELVVVRRLHHDRNRTSRLPGASGAGSKCLLLAAIGPCSRQHITCRLLRLWLSLPGTASPAPLCRQWSACCKARDSDAKFCHSPHPSDALTSTSAREH